MVQDFVHPQYGVNIKGLRSLDSRADLCLTSPNQAGAEIIGQNMRGGDSAALNARGSARKARPSHPRKKLQEHTQRKLARNPAASRMSPEKVYVLA